MDQVERYRQIVRETLLPYTEYPYTDDKVVYEAVFDERADRYIVTAAGWLDEDHRIYFNLVHVDIIDGKIWIQYDGTEDGVGYDFERAGVPKEDIVPAFHPVSVRPHTGYGVG